MCNIAEFFGRIKTNKIGCALTTCMRYKQYGPVVELAYTTDLKSVALRACEFESRQGYQAIRGKMKYLITTILLFVLSGCYAPHSGSHIGVATPRVWYKRVCKQNLSNGSWRCVRVRVYRQTWDLPMSRFYAR
jgi:hypothetical protein